MVKHSTSILKKRTEAFGTVSVPSTSATEGLNVSNKQTVNTSSALMTKISQKSKDIVKSEEPNPAPKKVVTLNKVNSEVQTNSSALQGRSNGSH